MDQRTTGYLFELLFYDLFFFVVKATLLPSSSVQQPASLSSHIRGDFLEIIVRLVN